MSTGTLTPRTLRTRFLLLVALRWLPTGLTIPVTVLLASARGLSLAEIGLVTSVQGFVVLALELPTGGLADSLGRRPTLVLAGVVGATALSLLLVADSVPTYAAVMALQGVWRALDSGPLEAWYVDAALAADPGARLEGGLSAASAVLSAALAVGALASGGLVALGPVAGVQPLVVPVVAALVLSLVSTAAVLGLVTEVRPHGEGGEGGEGGGAWTAVRAVPATVAAGVRLVRGDRVLVALVAVELFWGFGSVAYELLTPVRLAEASGGGAAGTERAAALMGPVTAAAWAASAAGAALVPLLSRRTGPWVAAALLRVAQGAAVAAMGLLAGPVGVVAAFLACYAVHGASNPLHAALLHGRVTGTNRAVVLSVNSMVAQPAGAVGAIALGALAASASTPAAVLVGAGALALAAPLYLSVRPSSSGTQDRVRRWPRAARSPSTEPFSGAQGEHGRGLRT